MGNPDFGHPVLTKERPSCRINFLGKYRVTTVEVSHLVCNKLYKITLKLLQRVYLL